MTFFFRGKNTKVLLALKESKAREASLVQTLTAVVDSDGEVRGQLMLPGKVPTDEALVKLKAAEGEIQRVTGEAAKLRREIDAERKNNEKVTQLVEAVNNGSVVQIRLPGSVVKPDRTPCGDMCKYAYFVDKHGDIHTSTKGERPYEQSGKWRCKARQGNLVSSSRQYFLDANNQCVMFERDTDC